MKIAIRNVLGLCVLGILGASAGCSADVPDGTSAGTGATGDTAVVADGQPTNEALPAKDGLPAQEGLTIVKSDPNWGLKAVFKDADHAILIERRIGLPRHADKLSENPKLGQFEEDVLVTNEDGRVIMVQQGGDKLVEPMWKDRFDESVKLPLDVTKLTAELALLDRAAEQLLARPEALDATARQSIEGIRVVAQRPLTDYSRDSDGMSYGPGYNSLEIRYQNIFGGTGQHSATWSNINGYSYVTCNHGSCANGSDMYYMCTTWQKSLYATVPYCTSYYWWDSEYGHNCHDDTVLQLWGFKYGTGSGSGGLCNDQWKHFVAPNCGTTSW
jgi:hypothetical protein